MPSPPLVVGLSDIGRTRSRNEDSICLLPDLSIAVVADGMGGHPGGDIASAVAAETAARVLAQRLPGVSGSEDLVGALRAAMVESVASAHAGIRERGAEDPELLGMGTTLTAMAVAPGTSTYVVGHVGDSRAYRLRDCVLEQLTRDHTWVQERLEARQLTPEQARNHPFSHLLTQCVGLDVAPEPHIVHGELADGDAYLLCTDGLVGMLDDADLSRILQERLAMNGQESGPEAAVQALLDAANEAGGHDNITAAIVRVPR